MAEGLAGRTLFITGGSRGIGLAIALRAARDGANVALLAKTAEPHPKLPGTVYTAAEEIEAAGGTALPIVGDVRDADSVAAAVEQTAERFGGIDICVNNASAISLTPIEQTEPKRFDLMQSINVRGTFLAMRACIPHLKRSGNGHILTLSPPINLDPRWLGAHAAYTLSKYGMSLLTLGAAEELREAGVAANCLWPRTIIATAAVQNLLGGDESMAKARTPGIYADSAYLVVTTPARERTGQTLIDDEVLAEAGITDLERYRAGEGDAELIADLFVDDAPLRA
jgi:citronellol/citronellal dehydrogenase